MTGADRPGGDDRKALYGLEPSEFTAARNALSKRLKAAGDKESAAQVAKLRKPPVTAWALNTVARRLPGVIDAVIDAGAGLRAATENALAGDASGLRTAQAWERRAVDAAVTTAAEVLADAGHGTTDAARQRMAGTLRAAMVDPTVAEALRGGVLDDDREAPGFGLDAFTAAAAGSAATRRTGVPAPAPAAATRPTPEAPEQADEERRATEKALAAEEAAAAGRKAKRLAGDADAAQAAADKALAAAAKARTLADDAAARAVALEQAAETAREVALVARKAADEAAAMAVAPTTEGSGG